MLPFFLVAISNGSFGLALVLFVATGISDGVDGYLARRFDMKSALGAYLDPIADKLVMMSSYVFLSISSYPGQYKIPFWLVVLVVSRDVLLLTVALLLILTGSKVRFPADVGRQGRDRDDDRQCGDRPLREPLGLARADGPRGIRSRGDRRRLLRIPVRLSRGPGRGGDGAPRDPAAPPVAAGLPPLRRDARRGGRSPGRYARTSGRSPTWTPTPSLAARYGNEIPVLFVNGRLFAKIRLPRLAARLRLLRAAGVDGR